MDRPAYQRAEIAARLRSLASLLLVVTAAILPFELKTPIAVVGPIAVTNVEIVLYLGLFVWLLSVAAGGPPGWTWAHTAVCGWAVSMMLSASMAAEGRALAWKFTLRGLGGCALFLMAADLGRQVHARVLGALLIGGVGSAVAGMLEMWSAPAASALSVFKTQPSRIGSFLRASGTFQYANIAAMYWEAMLPIGIGLSACGPSEAPSRRALNNAHPRMALWMRVASMAAVVCLLEAIVLSASRAALSVVLALLIGIAALGGLASRRSRASALASLARLSAVSIGVLALLIALPQTSSGLVALRLRAPQEATWYRVRYETPAPPAQLQAGAGVFVDVIVHNESVVTWEARGRNAVALSYHWHDPRAKRLVMFDGLRTPLPRDLHPGESAQIRAHVVGPPVAGELELQWDLVQEHVTWFSVQGGRLGHVPMRILPRSTAEPPLPPVRTTPPMPTEERPPRLALWRAAMRMWMERPLFGVGPDNYRHLWGPYLGRRTFDTRIHANNFFIEVLVTLGAVGAIAFVALSLAVIAAWRRAWRAACSDRRVVLVGLGLGLATFYVHGLADYFLEFTSTYALFWLLAGLIVGLGEEDSRESGP